MLDYRPGGRFARGFAPPSYTTTGDLSPPRVCRGISYLYYRAGCSPPRVAEHEVPSHMRHFLRVPGTTVRFLTFLTQRSLSPWG
jgi:hypothetical protein